MKHNLVLHRFMSTSNVRAMKCWKVDRYANGNDFLKLQHDVRVPPISAPDQILIKVRAASVNPIDLRMREGYGRTLLSVYRQLDQCSFQAASSELPLTLGRDCSGVVTDTGCNVTKFKPGDEVWCSVGAEKQGCFSEYVLANDKLVSSKPKSLSFIEAASVPYVACTVWPALCTLGRLNNFYGRKFSVLIHAGTGGVGSFAVQLAKAYNARVTATCSKTGRDFLKEIGANGIVDYEETDAFDQLANFGPYDLILDSVDTQLSRDSIKLLGLWRGCMHVNICNPLLRNADNRGLWPGMMQSAFEFSTNFLRHAVDGRISVWAYVYPSGETLDIVRGLVDNGLIKPTVHEVYPFDQLNMAFDRLEQGKVKGKIVINMEK